MSIKRKLISTIQKILLKRGYVLSVAMTLSKRPLLFDITDRMDYVRMRSLELCADLVARNSVSGAVAELGVYRGEFAQKINAAFPERSLYLFDTFEGFDSRDAIVERNLGFSNAKEDFSKTSIERVLASMPFPGKCVIAKGYFPDSAAAFSNERFAFVSIDADLYEPIRAGIVWFFQRLSPGGFIFVHDYNNDLYPGVASAVKVAQACKDFGFVPIPDCAGSVVITKPNEDSALPK